MQRLCAITKQFQDTSHGTGCPKSGLPSSQIASLTSTKKPHMAVEPRCGLTQSVVAVARSQQTTSTGEPRWGGLTGSPAITRNGHANAHVGGRTRTLMEAPLRCLTLASTTTPRTTSPH
jgi:hypothetical protein